MRRLSEARPCAAANAVERDISVLDVHDGWSVIERERLRRSEGARVVPCHGSALPTELQPRIGTNDDTSASTLGPMSETRTTVEAPPHRYNAGLANQIEAKWQDRWEADHTFWTPNPSGPLRDGFDAAADRQKLFVLDMFPYPSGAGLHVGHPLGYIGTDVFARFMRMNGRNVLHAMGMDAFGLPAEQYAVQTGQHPRVTTEENIAMMRRQLRALGLGVRPTAGRVDHRRRVLPVDAVDLPPDLQLLVRRRRRPRPADRGARRRARRRHPRAGERRQSRRAAVGGSRRRRAPRRRRLVPARVPGGSARQLVPRARHRARQRRGHRRRPQRPRQPSGVQTPAEAVDAEHHVVRRPPARRPRPPRLARVDQAAAAQLDRPQRRRQRRVPGGGARGHRHRGVHDAPRHVVRGHLHGARARAPAGRRDRPGGVAAQLALRVARHVRSRQAAVGGGGVVPRVRGFEVGARASGRRPSEDRRVHRRVRAQPHERVEHPDLHRRLRADGLRHRRDHGGARARRTRLRVRARVRPADPVRRAAARRLAA